VFSAEQQNKKKTYIFLGWAWCTYSRNI